MEIHASCKFDYASIKALTYLSLYKREDPRKRFTLWSVVSAVLGAMLVWDIIFFRDPVFVKLFLLLIVLFLLECYFYFGLPKVRYKALAKMKEGENTYIFCDDAVKIHSQTPQYSSDSQVAYSVFIKAFETTGYFFLFQTKNHVFIVNKSTIEGGTADQIREKLLASLPKKKYITCKY